MSETKINPKVEKPICILREEFTGNLFKLISESNLSIYHIDQVIANVHMNVQNMIRLQEEDERKAYNDMIKNEGKKEE